MTDTTTPPSRPEWLTPAIWPFQLTTIKSGDHQLSVTDTGEGPTLLIVHVGMWSILWRDLLLELQSDFRCVTFDAPANGLTNGPTKIDIRDAAAAVNAVVQHLDLHDITLVFHDLGGAACLQAAGSWPERVQGIVAINTFGWKPFGLMFRSMLASMGNPVMREIEVWTGWLPRMASTRFGVGRRWERPTRRAFRRGMNHRGRRSFHRYMNSVRRHDFATIDSVMDELAHIPLLTVFGEKNDPLGFQPTWAARFADCTHVVIKSGMHFPMCDDPKRVGKAITTWRNFSHGP